MRRGAGHAAGCGRGSLCALCPPRPFGCVPGQLRTSPNRPAHALRSASIAGGEIELALLCAEGQGMLPTPGRACRERCARRAARVPSWTEPCPCVSLCRRVVDLHERVRTSTLAPTLTPAPTYPSPGSSKFPLLLGDGQKMTTLSPVQLIKGSWTVKVTVVDDFKAEVP